MNNLNKKIIRAGIVGVSGYSGAEALKILLKHGQVRVTYVSANNTKGTIDEIWPNLKGLTNLVCSKYDPKKAIELCDVIFLAVPHTKAMSMAPALLKAGKLVIDISADYRLKKLSDYIKWYKKEHKDPSNLKKAVYGLPEIYREDIKKAQLIANPGCYPTAALLALAPLVSTQGINIDSIAIDAKSGVSGAGRKASTELLYSENNENFKAYKALNHQHTPEIEQYLQKLGGKKFKVDFVPHLLPVNRGILETIYVRLNKSINLANAQKIYERFYKKEPFVRVLKPGVQPELKNVCNTNYCDIGLSMGENKKLIVITSAIDNLVKGASGQAVQNMNIACGFKEREGLL